MSNTCVCCGKEIPEGRQVCLTCEGLNNAWPPDAILEDGTHLYLKTGPVKPSDTTLQLFLYNLLTRGNYNENQIC